MPIHTSPMFARRRLARRQRSPPKDHTTNDRFRSAMGDHQHMQLQKHAITEPCNQPSMQAPQHALLEARNQNGFTDVSLVSNAFKELANTLSAVAIGTRSAATVTSLASAGMVARFMRSTRHAPAPTCAHAPRVRLFAPALRRRAHARNSSPAKSTPASVLSILAKACPYMLQPTALCGNAQQSQNASPPHRADTREHSKKSASLARLLHKAARHQN